MSDVLERIKEQVTNNKVVLYMKGSPAFPQCGFSARAAQVLQLSGLSQDDFLAVDVLQDFEIRQGIKEFSNWPTIPQLYLDGEFVGGSDIVTEMYQNGEIQQKIKELQEG